MSAVSYTHLDVYKRQALLLSATVFKIYNEDLTNEASERTDGVIIGGERVTTIK